MFEVKILERGQGLWREKEEKGRGKKGKEEGKKGLN